MAIPLTTQIKEKLHYHKIIFNQRQQCAMLLQVRVLDSKRLDRKMGSLTREEFNKLKESLNKKILNWKR